MKASKEPGGDHSHEMKGSHTPGGNFLPIFLTIYKEHPYIAALFAVLVISLPFWPKILGLIIEDFGHDDKAAKVYYSSFETSTSPSIYQPVSTEIKGKITGPSSTEPVSYTPLWEGSVDNLPEDRELYLAIENSKHELYMYKTRALNGWFRFFHHLGNNYEGIGQEFWVRLFVPSPGVDIHEGCQESPPSGQYVSPVKKYLRRANLPGEE